MMRGLYILVRSTYPKFLLCELIDWFVVDIKPSNVLVNYDHSDIRFADVQLADFGATVHMDSLHAQYGEPISTPIFRSPEAHLQMQWGTATDIWSFGATAS
jgi:serine/threonine protein kinase